MNKDYANAEEVGYWPPPQPRIKSMREGDVRYIMAHWYSKKTGQVNLNGYISTRPGGSVELEIQCVVPQKEYVVKYIGDGEYYYE